LSTRISDDGMKELATHRNLSALFINGEDITDKGVQELAVLTNLGTLHLGRTQVSDKGLKVLAPPRSATPG
jgi:internalin A